MVVRNPDRFVQGNGSGGGGGLVTQGTVPWEVQDAPAEASLVSILAKLGDILTQLMAVIDVNVTGGNVTLDAGDIEIGAVEIKNNSDDTRATVTPLNALKVDGSAVTQPVSGTVSVTEPVSVDDNGGSLTVDGSVSVLNFPATQPVSGTVSVTEPVSVDDNGGSLTVDGSVAVSNMIPAVETGLATSARQDTLAGKVPDEEGTWSYRAGTSGTVNVPALGRVIGIAAATSQSGGTVTINGGDAVPIPIPTSGVGAVDIAPRGNLVAPSIVFANTDSFLVEILS